MTEPPAPSARVRRRRRRSAGPGLTGWVRGLRHRPRALAALGALGVLAIAVGWGLFTASRVAGHLEEARDEALVMRAALVRGDADAAEAAMGRLQRASADAEDATSGPTWWVARRLPFLGDDARGLATVSAVMRDLSTDGVPPLVDAADQVTADALTPRDHRFPLRAIADLGGPARASQGAFTDAGDTLAGVDSDGFLPAVRTSVEQLRDVVEDAETGLDAAYRASRLAPLMLGADGPRDYALIFQNNAELRSTGGLPGNVALVHAEDGEVEITDQYVGGAFAQARTPVLPLAPEEATLYGPQLGTFFVDANFSPDLPRAAELWREHWNLRLGTDIDGVVTVDPVAMSYLLAATGPIEVDGVSIDAANVVQTLENGVYLNLATNEEQDAFFDAVARTTFDVFADGTGDPVELMRGLARGVEEGRVRMHSFVPAEQADVAGTMIAGELQSPDEVDGAPQIGVFLNDGTGAKLSYYLDYDVKITSVSCDGGAQTYTGTVRATSNTPDDVASLPESVLGPEATRGRLAPGQQVVVADLFAPVGGTFDDVVIDGEPLERPLLDRYDGRRVLSVGFYLAPGQSQRVEFTVTSGPDQPGETRVSVTPGVLPENESSTIPSPC